MDGIENNFIKHESNCIKKLSQIQSKTVSGIKSSSRKKLKKAMHHIEKERIRWLSHREELMIKLDNSNLSVKGDKKRVQLLVHKEFDKSLAKEDQLRHKIEELDLFTFELDEEVRDVYRKRRAAHNMPNTSSNWHIGGSIGRRNCSKG